MPYIVPQKTDDSIFGADQSAFHGLKVDRTIGSADEGKLIYTKTFLNASVTVDLADSGVPYNGVDDANSGTANAYQRGTSTELSDRRTPGTRAYDGVRFDIVKLTYFMDADGFLVARYFQDFTYNTGSNGQTKNYIQ